MCVMFLLTVTYRSFLACLGIKEERMLRKHQMPVRLKQNSARHYLHLNWPRSRLLADENEFCLDGLLPFYPCLLGVCCAIHQRDVLEGGGHRHKIPLGNQDCLLARHFLTT